MCRKVFAPFCNIFYFFPFIASTFEEKYKDFEQKHTNFSFKNIIDCDHISFSGIYPSKGVSEKSLPSLVKVNSPLEPTLGLEPYLWLSWLKKKNKLLQTAVCRYALNS